MSLLLVLFTLFVVYIAYFYYKVKQLPPGPTPIPLFGNIIQILVSVTQKKTMVETMKEWKKTYGDVMTIYLGPIPIVSICDYDVAYENMVKKGNLFTDRWVPYILTLIRKGKGIITSNGQLWQEQRRFALHALRNLGLGRNIIQDRIMMELNYRMDKLEKQVEESNGKQEMDIQHFLFATVGNIINRMIFTERFTEEKEEKFFGMLDNLEKTLKNSSIFDWFIRDWNIEFPPIRKRLDWKLRTFNDILDFINGQVNTRLKDIEEGRHVINENPEDYVDAFILEMEKSEKNNEKNSFTRESLTITLLDLWIAGQETTATTLYWAFLYLAKHPQYMDKLVKELDDVTGGEREIELNDKVKTPYLNAVITETLRVSTLLPNNLMRTTAEDTTVAGYFIPKGTNITAQLSQIMRNDDKFPNSSEFNPERFLVNNNFSEQVIPFGIGKRACPGESLARAELYLILSNILLRFHFEKSDNSELSMGAHTEFAPIRKAQSYKLLVSTRSKN